MNHEALESKIAHVLHTVAEQVPVRERIAEVQAAADSPTVGRWRFAEMPAMAGVAAFVVGLTLVGGVLLTLRNNTNEPPNPAVPVATTSTTTTTVEIAPAAGGPCVDAEGNLVGQHGIQLRSGSAFIGGSFGHDTVGYCPGHPDHGTPALAGDGFLEDLESARLQVEPGAEMMLTAPGYPGASVDASWSFYSLESGAYGPSSPALAAANDPGSWTLSAPSDRELYVLSLRLEWFEGEATYAVLVGVGGQPPQESGVPDGFETGPELAAEIRSELPPSYLRLGFEDSMVLMTVDGQPIGHIPGSPEPPIHDQTRLQQLTAELGEEWDVPEGCLVDSPLDETQVRILCEAPGESPDGNPTVEILFLDGRREVVAELPRPPAGLDGAFRLGHFLEVMPAPVNRGVALAQFSAECESRLALMINDTEVRHIDGSEWWDGGYPDGESIAVGWGPDHRALVWRFNGVCSTELSNPGIYAYDSQGFGELLFATPDALQWVEMVIPLPATTTAALYPVWTAAQLEDLLLAESPLPEDVEVVTSFARDVLGLEEPSVMLIGDGTDSAAWQVVAGGLDVAVRTQIITWRSDGSAVVAVTNASTFASDEEFVLSARVLNNNGSWTAEFRFPQLGDEVAVVFASGDWAVESTTHGDSVTSATIDLPEEPVETPRLSITFRDGGEVVGFHGVLLPAGEFAAG